LLNDETEYGDEEKVASVLLLLPGADLILVSLPHFLLPSNDPLTARKSPNFCPILPPPPPIPPIPVPPLLFWGLPELIFLLLDKNLPPLLLLLAPPRPLELLILSPLPYSLLPLLVLLLLFCLTELPLFKVDAPA
jgi:hypothetical protein